jgi:hypothetical protein
MTITEQLREVIDSLEERLDDINRDDFTTLIFRFQNGKFKKFEKNYSKEVDDLGIKIKI